jgi:putative transposase
MRRSKFTHEQIIEMLNENWCIGLEDARKKIEACRVDYGGIRPHSSVDIQTPTEFARSLSGLTPVAV